jgi:predicted TIM-barrel fold metal-dependent hydrolase
MAETTYTVISSDSHVIEPPHLWAPRMPAKLRDRAPKITHDTETDRLSYDNGTPLQPVGVLAGCYREDAEQRWEGRWEEDIPKGCYDSTVRLADIQRDGVDAEVLYPTIGMQFFPIEDFEFQTALMRAYNEWLAEEFCGANPDRFFGVAMVNPEDVDHAIGEVQRAKDLGLVGIMVAMYAGDDFPYYDERFDPLWATCAELQMPFHLHLTTARNQKKLVFGAKKRYPTPGEIMSMAAGIQGILVDLIAFGLFDRHPDLQVVSAENDAGWAAHIMDVADYNWHRLGDLLDMPKSKFEPSHYFRNNIKMTFMRDRAAILTAPIIGKESLMWGNDFPHQTSTWPRSQEALDLMFDGQPDDLRQAVVCDNVRKLYGI